MTQSPQNKVSSINDEISLNELVLTIKKWFEVLLSRWLIIVFFGILGAILGFTYAYFQKPVFTATTTFALEDEKAGGGLSSLAGLASIAGVDIGAGGGSIFQGDNILQLYKSRSMIEKTLLSEVDFQGKKVLLINRYIDFNDLHSSWASKDGLKDLKFSANDNSKLLTASSKRLRDSVINDIVKKINNSYLTVAKPDKKLNIIQADVKSEDEFFSKAFNEQIVKNVNDFYVQTKTKKSIENVNILQHKTDSVRAVMNGAIFTAATVADATPNINPTRLIQRVVPIQKSQFSIETNKIILGELVKNLEMSKMALLKEKPLIQVIDEPVLPLDKKKFRKLTGLVFGGFLGGFTTCLILIFRRSSRNNIKT